MVDMFSILYPSLIIILYQRMNFDIKLTKESSSFKYKKEKKNTHMYSFKYKQTSILFEGII